MRLRNPIVENKYNLTVKDCKNAVVLNRDKVCEPTFWRNNVIGAWCLSGETHFYGSGFWLGIYDNTDRVNIHFTAYGGMCNYIFNKFYSNDMECIADLEIQEMFLKVFNGLLDEGIIGIEGVKMG